MEPNLDQLVDVLPGLVWIARPDGRAEFLNQRWVEYTGLSRDQAIGLGWYDAIHPNDLAMVLAHWRSLLESGRAGEVEARLRRHDGHYRRFLFSASPMADESGQIVRWCGINTDIENHVRSDDATRKRQWALAEIVDGLPAIVALFTTNGKIMYCNRRMLEYLDETLEQVQKKASAYNFHPEDRDELLAEWAASVKSGRPFDREARLCGADGIYRWHRTLAFPLRNAVGEIELWYGHSTDIDDTKRAEAALRRAHGFLTEAQQLSNTGSFTWDASTGEETWSDQLYRIFEIDPATKITPAVVRRHAHPDDLPLLKATTEQAIAGEAPDYFFRIVTSRGAIKHLHCVGHRSEQIVDRPVFIGAIQDVTERKLAEEALNKARSDLTHVARAMTLSALTASIAHEVNQPLLGIITNASTCLRMLAADPPNLDGARATAQRTLRDGDRASEVIQRLRALFARKEPTTEPVDLNDAAREVLALSASELRRAGVTLKTELDDLAVVHGDRVQLQQVILNLVLNAADAMSAVEGRPRILLITTTSDETDGVRLSVSDCGVGIDPLNYEKLFDSFYTTKSDGMGIGLSISRSIIASHEGRLWAAANDGPGATFTFSIPRRPASADRIYEPDRVLRNG